VEPDEVGRYQAAVPAFRATERAADRAGPGGTDLLVTDTLDFLRGRWRIERRIADHRAGGTGTFDGVARFEAGGAEAGGAKAGGAEAGGAKAGRIEAAGIAVLTYHERGELCFGGHRGPASRSLIYRRRPDGAADVCFADGREFYRLDVRSGHWEGQHDCGRDRYTVCGDMLGSGRFRERWQARGPDKDYEITTILVRR
jgi:Family of unknown function (DUF6314)